MTSKGFVTSVRSFDCVPFFCAYFQSPPDNGNLSRHLFFPRILQAHGIRPSFIILLRPPCFSCISYTARDLLCAGYPSLILQSLTSINWRRCILCQCNCITRLFFPFRRPNSNSKFRNSLVNSWLRKLSRSGLQ